MSDRIPFNAWSRERIAQGRKKCTSRKKKYMDPRVTSIDVRPWSYVKDFLWKDEGADSPEELQRVINQIFRREVKDDEIFYVHFGDFTDAAIEGRE